MSNPNLNIAKSNSDSPDNNPYHCFFRTSDNNNSHQLRVASVSNQVSASRLLNAPIVLTFVFVKISSSTRCVGSFVGWCGRAGVLGCRLLVVGLAVVCLKAAKRPSERAQVVGEGRDQTLVCAGKIHCSGHCCSGRGSWRLIFSECVGDDPDQRTTSTARHCAPLQQL